MSDGNTGGISLSDMEAGLAEMDRLREKLRTILGDARGVFAEMARVAGGLGGAPVAPPPPPAAPAWSPPPAPAQARFTPPATRARPGELKAAILRVLADGRPRGPGEIAETLPKVGYRSSSTPKVFYNTVFLALKTHKGVRNIGGGKYQIIPQKKK